MFSKSLFYFFLITLFFSCQNNQQTTFLPSPTEIASFAQEDGDNQVKRQDWIEAMHRSAPGVNWRDIEYQNQLERSERRLRDKNNYRNCSQESIANEQLFGQWYEIGSTNQAGSILITEYDPINEKVWAISGGGTLWRGERDGSAWEAVNQDYKFGNRFLQILNTTNGQRILAQINSKPHYSDDGGLSWTAATWLGSATLFTFTKNVVVLDSGVIYILTRAAANQDYKLYKSVNDGAFFTLVENFTNAFNDDVSICRPQQSDEIYGIERRVDHNKLFRLNQITDELVEVSTTSEFTSHYSLLAWEDDNENHFYIYDDNLDVYTSNDYGSTWQLKGQMPEQPWSVGMQLSNSNPSVLMFGAVNCFKSLNGGSTWVEVNDWSDYYDNVQTKLHADMMHFGTFETGSGIPFILVSNHGGISISYDNLFNNYNIGQEGLNVGQYYCVRTLPNTNTVFAGTQDQGFQRGLTNFNQAIPMNQVISGDYGKIVFSDLNQRTWTVYPGGWVTYYHNSANGGIAQTYELNSPDESTWLPPLMASPNTFENVIYMAGGNITANNGSHLVRLEITAPNQPIIVSQSPYDFRSNPQAGTLTALGHSQFDVNRFYAATSNGFFYSSTDQGQTWTASNSNTLEGHYLYGQAIYASTIDAETVWVAGSGYSNPGVFMSTDGGQNFQPFNTGLPSTMVFDLTGSEDGKYLFAATENGPYVYVFSEGQWFDLSGQCAPTQTYWSVEYLDNSQTVRFGTYGRGIWDFIIQEESVGIQNDVQESTFEVFPNPSNGFFNLSNLPADIEGIDLYDMQGKLLEKLTSNTQQIDLRNYPKGMYILTITTNGSQQSKRLILQ